MRYISSMWMLLALAGTAAGQMASDPSLPAECPEGEACLAPDTGHLEGGFIELLDPPDPWSEENEAGEWAGEDWAMGDEAGFPIAPPEPSVAFLEWGRGRVVDDPSYAQAHGCARTPARARGRLVRALQEGDINGLLSIYSWRDKGNGSVAGVLARLEALPAHGQWEGTRVGMWTGTGDVRHQVPTHWRWSDGHTHHHFSMRQDNECWLVEFSDPPSEVVEVVAESPSLSGTEMAGSPDPYTSGPSAATR